MRVPFVIIFVLGYLNQFKDIKIKKCLVICYNPFSIMTLLMMIWLLLESTKDRG